MHSLLPLLLTSFLASAQDKPPVPPPPPPPPPPAEKTVTPPTTEESIFKTFVKQFTLGGQVRIRAEYRGRGRDPIETGH